VVLFIALCAYYIVSHRDEFSFLRTVSIPYLMVAAGFVLVSYFLTGYQLGLFLAKFGLRIGLLERLTLTMGMLLGNLVFPLRGGTAGLAVYLKTVHRLEFESFALIYGGTALLVGLINSAAAAGALVYLAVEHHSYYPSLTVLTGGALFGSLYLVLLPPATLSTDQGILGSLARVSQGWQNITLDKNLMKGLVASTVLIVITLIGAFYFIYGAIGSSIAFSAIVMTSSIGNIANLVPITPGSLGVFDTATIKIPQLFGIDVAQSLAVTIILRSLCFGWALLLGIPSTFYLMKKRTKISEQLVTK
jgi:uncharacterized membrane protein YbhN (UPF0104 family)